MSEASDNAISHPLHDKDAAFKEIADAIYRLRSAFQRCGMKPPVSIELGQYKDGDHFRYMMPADMMRFDASCMAKGAKDPEWVGSLAGVEVRMPAQWRMDAKGKRHAV